MAAARWRMPAVFPRVGYFSGSIEYADQFLAQTPEFVVVDDPGLLWFERARFWLIRDSQLSCWRPFLPQARQVPQRRFVLSEQPVTEPRRVRGE